MSESDNLKEIMTTIKKNNFCCRGINLNNLNYENINDFKKSLAIEFAIKTLDTNDNKLRILTEWNDITQKAFESFFHWGLSNKYSFTESQCNILEKYFGIFEMPSKPEPYIQTQTNEIVNDIFNNFRRNYKLYYYSDDEDERIYPLIRT